MEHTFAEEREETLAEQIKKNFFWEIAAVEQNQELA
jgi:hypothetical protein